MNKFNVALIGLVAVVCFVSLVHCGDGDNKDGLSNELGEDEDFGPDGGPFGARDVIEEGVEKFVETKENACRKSKNAEMCQTCCSGANMASKYVYEPSVKRLKQHVCYCFERAILH